MEKREVKSIGMLVVFIFLTVTSVLQADERIGNLVFEAMKKIQENHQNYLSDLKEVRKGRDVEAAELNDIKKQYRKKPAGSLEQREFHARYSLGLAKVLSHVRSETSLTHESSRKQLHVLQGLTQALKSGEASMSAGQANAIIEASKPILNNGRSLLASLTQYRDHLNDPVVTSKLNAAAETAQMLSRYSEQLERGVIGNNASHKILERKIADLTEQLAALYAQTDILLAMISDRAMILKIINQLAMSEAIFMYIGEGNRTIVELSKSVVQPIEGLINQSDEDIKILIDGIDNNEANHETGGSSAPRWTNVKF